MCCGRAARYSLLTAHGLLPTAHCPLPTAHRSLLAAHCSLLVACFTTLNIFLLALDTT